MSHSIERRGRPYMRSIDGTVYREAEKFALTVDTLHVSQTAPSLYMIAQRNHADAAVVPVSIQRIDREGSPISLTLNMLDSDYFETGQNIEGHMVNQLTEFVLHTRITLPGYYSYYRFGFFTQPTHDHDWHQYITETHAPTWGNVNAYNAAIGRRRDITDLHDGLTP